MKSIDCTHNFGQTGKNRRDDFWRQFCEAEHRRRSIASRINYLLGAEADPSALTPGQVENIPLKIAKLLDELGAVPAYAEKLAAIEPRLNFFAAAAQDWLAEYSADPMPDRVIAAKNAVDVIFETSAPKSSKAWQTWKAQARFDAAKIRAEKMLSRDYPGLTSAERRFAMTAFHQFRRPE